MRNRKITSVILLLSAAFIALPLHAQVVSDYAGHFSSETGVGIYGYSNADRPGPNDLAPAVYGQSNKGVGVYGQGDTSNSSSFNNEGGYFEGGSGIYARGTDYNNGYGARIFSDNFRGMYVQGRPGYFDAYFGGDGGISTVSVTDRVAAAVDEANGTIPMFIDID